MRDTSVLDSVGEWLEADERPYLVAVIQDPGDVLARRAYIHHLESRPDPDGRRRALALRLGLQLGESPTAEAEESLRKELRVLLSEISADWAAAVFPLDIRNCGVPGPNADRRVRFDFRCPRLWETLRPTADPDIRSCDACAQPVHRCDTVDEANRRALRGECIAVTSALTAEAEAEDGHLVIIGRPEGPVRGATLWSRRLFEPS